MWLCLINILCQEAELLKLSLVTVSLTSSPSKSVISVRVWLILSIEMCGHSLLSCNSCLLFAQ